MKEIIDMAKKVAGRGGSGGEEFQDMDLGEIKELTDTTPEKLTEDDLIKMSVSKPVPEDDEENVEEAVPGKQIDIRQSGRKKGSRIIQDCI